MLISKTTTMVTLVLGVLLALAVGVPPLITESHPVLHDLELLPGVSGVATVVPLMVVGLIAMGADASPALAETHPFLFSFGSFTNPNGIAIDESTGDVYVADLGTNTVSKFDARESGRLFGSRLQRTQRQHDARGTVLVPQRNPAIPPRSLSITRPAPPTPRAEIST